jgi:KaiC/GvpD/RAD55 family RecA-like ATPase
VPAIAAALLTENRAKCSPPPSDDEVRGIARGKAGIPPDAAPGAGGEPADLLQAAFWARDARLNIDLPYIIKGLFAKGHLVVLWGEPGSGKSFNALEMASAVGSGQRWRGRRTRKGVVLYIAAESSRPYIENRLVALNRECPDFAEAELLVVPLTLDPLHAERGDVDRVIATACAIAKERGEVVRIVIDTLAVTFAGGDENSSADMGRYVTNVKRIIAEVGAAGLVVHHCGKDVARGMRGHSVLLAALDAKIAIEKTEGGERILRTGNVRDGDGQTDLLAFTLRPVDLGLDEDGDRVRSCVVDGLGDAELVKARRSSRGLGRNQRTIITVLEKRDGMTRPELVQVLRDEYGLSKSAAQHSISDLLARNAVRNLHGVLTLE